MKTFVIDLNKVLEAVFKQIEETGQLPDPTNPRCPLLEKAIRAGMDEAPAHIPDAIFTGVMMALSRALTERRDFQMEIIARHEESDMVRPEGVTLQ